MHSEAYKAERDMLAGGTEAVSVRDGTENQPSLATKLQPGTCALCSDSFGSMETILMCF